MTINMYTLDSGNVELCQQTPTIPSVLLSTQGITQALH